MADRGLLAMLRADDRFRFCACLAGAPSAVAASREHEPGVCVLAAGLSGGGTAAAQEIAARLPGLPAPRHARRRVVGEPLLTARERFRAALGRRLSA
jgi:hypothetical protein